MANEEQLAILKQGVEVWNKWRHENPIDKVDFSGADLSRADLKAADLSEGDLSKASLVEAKLSKANLYGVDFSGADLTGAYFTRADLNRAKFRKAKLESAYLTFANLREADLRNANLNGVDLSEANLTGAYFEKATLDAAWIGGTIWANITLSETMYLEQTLHLSPSFIDIHTLQLSKGEIPELFLRGCGLSDWEIESAKLYKPGLSNQEIIDINYKIFDLRANRAIQVSPLFISYSHEDTEFVDKLEPQFVEKGIRFWRDIHDMTSGRMEKQVDHAMRQNPTVILALSENSIHSDWMEHEATLARKLEKELGRDVLCPVALDDSWKSARWPARLMQQIMEYNILDFSKWKDDSAFGQVFNKMIAGLDMFYKPDTESPK